MSTHSNNCLDTAKAALAKARIKLDKTFNFVRKGKSRPMQRKLKTKGRRQGGDNHTHEDNLLINAGMVKTKKQWICNPEFEFNGKPETIKALIDDLLFVVCQRCARMQEYGYKNIESFIKHCVMVQYFIDAIENIANKITCMIELQNAESSSDEDSFNIIMILPKSIR